MQTQSIIVYRNPAEQMLWEGGYMWPIICVGGTFVLVLVILMTIAKQIMGEWAANTNMWVTAAAGGISALAAFGVGYWMWFI
jgi:hypothetical protein